MILVVGLGNPGRRYQDTRHNVGFMAVDELARRSSGVVFRARFNGDFAQLELGAERAILLKPQTYMNESGHSVRMAMAFFKLDLDALLIVHDEMDLPFGEIRLKRGGGEAGHNGLRSITAELGASDYPRLRFGIGRPPAEYGGQGAGYVLDGFTPAEQTILSERVVAAADAITLVVREGLERAMNVVNQRAPRSV